MEGIAAQFQALGEGTIYVATSDGYARCSDERYSNARLIAQFRRR